MSDELVIRVPEIRINKQMLKEIEGLHGISPEQTIKEAVEANSKAALAWALEAYNKDVG